MGGRGKESIGAGVAGVEVSSVISVECDKLAQLQK